MTTQQGTPAACAGERGAAVRPRWAVWCVGVGAALMAVSAIVLAVLGPWR